MVCWSLCKKSLFSVVPEIMGGSSPTVPHTSCVTGQYMVSNLKVQKSKWLMQQYDVLLPSCKINVVNDCVKLFVDHSDVFWYISCCHKTLITATVLNTSMKMPIIHFFSVCIWLTSKRQRLFLQRLFCLSILEHKVNEE